MKFIPLLFFILIYGVAIAGETGLSDFPPGTKLMPAKKVLLILGEQKSMEFEYPSRPCIINDIVNLVPGEKIFIETEVKADRLVSLKQVESIEYPDRTIEVEFNQVQDGKPPFMMLSINNPFSKGLKYQTSIQYPMKERIYKTSNIGVRPKLKSYESWPQPLTRIILNNFQLVEQNEELYTKP
jgi:hypothetical protein